MLRVYRVLRRLNSVWTAPVLTFAVFVVLFVAVPTVLGAQANPSGVTAQACRFGSGWTDGISRWVFGVSIILFALAALAGGMAVRSGSSGGGGEAVGGAIGGVAGIGIVLGLLGAVGLLSAIAITAAGGSACP